MKLKISMFQLKLVLSTSHLVGTVRTAVCNVRGHRQRITCCRYGWSQGNSVIVTFTWYPSLIWWCVCRGSVQCLSAAVYVPKLHPPPPAHCPLCRPLLPPTLALSSHQLRCPVSRVTTDHPPPRTCPHMSPHVPMLHAACCSVAPDPRCLQWSRQCRGHCHQPPARPAPLGMASTRPSQGWTHNPGCNNSAAVPGQLWPRLLLRCCWLLLSAVECCWVLWRYWPPLLWPCGAQ